MRINHASASLIMAAAAFFIGGGVAAQAPQASGEVPQGAAPAPARVKYYSKAQTDAQFEKDELILDHGHNGHYFLETSRRVKPGDVETHLEYTDVFYVVKGSATLVTGGKMSGIIANATGRDGKLLAASEIRAKSLIGGEPHQLKAGDTIIIPNGIPHQFTEVQGDFWYLVVKVQGT
jgi:mannose-6-phosphate isomerase-like protein (cupin superfamily)